MRSHMRNQMRNLMKYHTTNHMIFLTGCTKMTSKIPLDMEKALLDIIEAVKQHPVLYINDVKGIDTPLQDFRQKVWQYIANELELDVNWMKLRWNNLRDTYRRIMKHKIKPGKGVRRKKWIYEDYLSFLMFPFEPNYQHESCEVSYDYVQLISNNLTSTELLEQLEDKEDKGYMHLMEGFEEQPNEKVSIVKLVEPTVLQNELDKDLLAQQIEAKFIKIQPKGSQEQVNQTPLSNSNVASDPETPVVINTQVKPPKKRQKVKNKSDVTAQPNKEDGTKSFQLLCNDMATTVKHFPKSLQSSVKFDICKAIVEAEMKSEKEAAIKKLDPVHTLPKLLLIPCHMIDKIK